MTEKLETLCETLAETEKKYLLDFLVGNYKIAQRLKTNQSDSDTSNLTNEDVEDMISLQQNLSLNTTNLVERKRELVNETLPRNLDMLFISQNWYKEDALSLSLVAASFHFYLIARQEGRKNVTQDDAYAIMKVGRSIEEQMNLLQEIRDASVSGTDEVVLKKFRKVWHLASCIV